MKTKAAHTSINEQLFKVVRSRSAKDVKRCLSRADCDPLARDDDGWTALMWAAWSGHEECVRMLLPVSDPLARSKGGYSALMLTAREGHEKCVKVLLPVSDPLAKDNDGRSASYIAMERGYPEVAGMIEAYVLAQKEEALLSTEILTAPPRRKTIIRL